MAKENSFSLTKITMTPATARNFCIVAAIVLTLVLAIGAVCWTQEGGSMFGNRGVGTSGGGGGGGGTSDLVDIDAAYTTVVECDEVDVPEDEPADDETDTGTVSYGASATAQIDSLQRRTDQQAGRHRPAPFPTDGRALPTPRRHLHYPNAVVLGIRRIGTRAVRPRPNDRGTTGYL